MNSSSATLTFASQQALAEAALVLEHAQAFVYVPILVPSERAGALALDQLQPALPTQTFRLPWPLPQAHTDDPQEAERRLQADLQAVMDALDDATRRLPGGALILLDASSSLRHAVARRLPVWLNQRREDWRRRGQGLLLLWPQSEREALMQGAPDLWSMRTLAPWVEEQLPDSDATALETRLTAWASPTGITSLSAAQQRRWDALLTATSWRNADVSAADMLGLLAALRKSGELGRGLALAERVLQAPEFQTQSPAWQADLMKWLSLLRVDSGDQQGALAPAQEAVAILRRLAQANPAAFEFALAMSQNNLSAILSETGDRAGALTVAQESVTVYRRLAQTNLVASEPSLAGGLINLANRLSETGDRAGALALAREAVEICRRLAKANPETYEPVLAMGLHSLASRLSETGDRAGALVPAGESVAIRRRLAQTDPANHEANLASSLNNLANRLSETGDTAGALAPAWEAVAIRRRLAQANPAVYESSLVASLSNLANRLSDTGDLEGALECAIEAVAIYHRLAQANPAAHEPDMAKSLTNLASFLVQTGDNAGALAPAREAVAIRRRLAQGNSAAYDHDLAMSLGMLMMCQAAAGDRVAAIKAGEEALALFTKLAERLPAAFERYRATTEQHVQSLRDN